MAFAGGAPLVAALEERAEKRRCVGAPEGAGDACSVRAVGGADSRFGLATLTPRATGGRRSATARRCARRDGACAAAAAGARRAAARVRRWTRACRAALRQLAFERLRRRTAPHAPRLLCARAPAASRRLWLRVRASIAAESAAFGAASRESHRPRRRWRRACAPRSALFLGFYAPERRRTTLAMRWFARRCVSAAALHAAARALGARKPALAARRGRRRACGLSGCLRLRRRA